MNLDPIIQDLVSEVSQKEKSKYRYISPYVWNLEKWYWWTYLQGRNSDEDMENRLIGKVG